MSDLAKLLHAEGAALEAYGKGVIVGIAGELEHAALWHQPSGFGIRHAINGAKSGGAKSIVPSTVRSRRPAPASTSRCTA